MEEEMSYGMAAATASRTNDDGQGCERNTCACSLCEDQTRQAGVGCLQAGRRVDALAALEGGSLRALFGRLRRTCLMIGQRFDAWETYRAQ